MSLERTGSSDFGLIRPFKPTMDLHEDKKKNQVTATFELPGINKQDISVDVNNNRLTVSGESHSSSEKNEKGYAIKERRYGKFSRTLQLPEGVKENQVKARMNDGVLTVTFPGAAPEHKAKKITVE
ncbi:small heat shock protein [Coprinopsis marcescibilis]|uniref:Small heat shock protein n=1 Tax=Coprinopsis marcescibilis TaxID=230819 RepID=A0A5C3LI87_COPMA|nr:small heat shock protein [Coprinopsis marcescibilis]